MENVEKRKINKNLKKFSEQNKRRFDGISRERERETERGQRKKMLRV